MPLKDCEKHIPEERARKNASGRNFVIMDSEYRAVSQTQFQTCHSTNLSFYQRPRQKRFQRNLAAHTWLARWRSAPSPKGQRVMPADFARSSWSHRFSCRLPRSRHFQWRDAHLNTSLQLAGNPEAIASACGRDRRDGDELLGRPRSHNAPQTNHPS